MMSEAPTIPIPGANGGDEQPISRWHGVAAWVQEARQCAAACRARRVVLLLLCLWLLNIFDLVFTILGSRLEHFEELNPLARHLLDHPAALTAFKLALLSFTSVVFVIFRRHWLTEFGCWCLATVYTVLAAVWLSYYHGYQG